MQIIGMPTEKKPESQKEETPKQKRGAHTMSDDMTKALVQTGGHNVKSAIAEEKEREKNQKAQSAIMLKNVLFGAGALGFVLIGVSVVVGVSAWRERKIPVVLNTYQAPLVAVETESPVLVSTLSRETFASTLAKSIESAAVATDTITGLPIYMLNDATRQKILADRIFGTLMVHQIPAFFGSLRGPITVGVYADKAGQKSAFLLAKVATYSQALTGMREWETGLFDDLHLIFGFKDGEETTKALFEAKFKEEVIRNQNVHSLKDKKGETVLFYTFLGERKDTLMIGTSANALEEVVRRLTAPTLKR